jgi:hypothetical protein
MRGKMKVDVEIDLDDTQIDAILCTPVKDKTVREYLSCSEGVSKQDVVRAIAREAFTRAEIRAG